jgi:hypothetical protein
MPRSPPDPWSVTFNAAASAIPGFLPQSSSTTHLAGSAHHPWFARDAAIRLCAEMKKQARAAYRHGLTSRILDAAGVISLHQAVLGNPIPLDRRMLNDV